MPLWALTEHGESQFLQAVSKSVSIRGPGDDTIFSPQQWQFQNFYIASGIARVGKLVENRL